MHKIFGSLFEYNLVLELISRKFSGRDTCISLAMSKVMSTLVKIISKCIIKQAGSLIYF